MHITILALGSRGDVQPFVPLGVALQGAGHDVRIATFEAFSGMIKKAGLEFHLIRGDARQLLNIAADGNLLSKRINFQTFRAMQQSYGTLAQTLPLDIAQLQDTDIILNQLPAHLFGGDLAEHLKIPWAILAVIPLTRTRSNPLIGFPNLPWLPGYNIFTYRLGEQIGWQLFRHSVNNLRTEQWNLPPTPFFGPYENIHKQKIPFICGFSPNVVQRPTDWEANVHLTGWWYPDDPDWNPPEDLIRFLDEGPPPLFIGFGSMPIEDPTSITSLIIEAVRLSGQRAILHAGWAGLGGKLPTEIFPIDYAPYGWLFPRMAAIVHHGGSGTSGFGFRSGIPSIFVPFVFDQFYWGERAFDLGVGPKPLPFKRLTSRRLAATIDTVLTNQEMKKRAAHLGQILKSENGLQRAIEIIQKLV